MRKIIELPIKELTAWRARRRVWPFPLRLIQRAVPLRVPLRAHDAQRRAGRGLGPRRGRQRSRLTRFVAKSPHLRCPHQILGGMLLKLTPISPKEKQCNTAHPGADFFTITYRCPRHAAGALQCSRTRRVRRNSPISPPRRSSSRKPIASRHLSCMRSRGRCWHTMLRC